MFMHNKKLMYTVRVGETNPKLASLLLEQFGGPQGELAAAMRYFTQAIGESDPGRKDMLLDIATEELSHLEVIGSMICMLTKGTKARLAEGMETADLYADITAGGESHTLSLLYGGGPALINSGGAPWTAAYIDTIGDPSADLRSNIAAEARAKILYERLINVTDDAGMKDALGFLMTREIAHQLQFEKALYSIPANFPPGKLPGKPEFTGVYFNMSQGEGDLSGPWNNENAWQVISDRGQQAAVDGGNGLPTAKLNAAEKKAFQNMSERTASDPDSEPVTGAEIGAGLELEATATTKPAKRK
jgi:Mn-containing catalase